MIRAFNATDKTFTTNGDAVIQAIKARVKNADNGDFYLELTCGSEYNEFIQANNILVVPTPQGEQAFRIREVTKNKNKLEVKAWHVYYDGLNYLIADSYAVDMTCSEALDHFNDATDNPSPFTMLSDIITVNSYRCVRTSLTECISTILERWGGHLKRNNWNISVLSNIGVDNGITIEYRKNLQELTASYDWANVVTKLLPVGKDGILLDELYIYSQVQYEIPYTKCVSFEQNINEEDYPNTEAYQAALKADLRAQAQAYVNTYCYPNANYSLKGNPEKVSDLGDIIRVKDARIGVDLLTSVIAYEYNALTNKYVSLEFGNFTKTLNGLMGNIERDTKTQVGQAVSGKQDKLTAGANITINGDVISAQPTTYKEGYGIDIADNVVSVEAISGKLEIVNNGHLGVIGFKNNNGLSFAVMLPKPWDSGVVELTYLSLTVYTSYAGATVVSDDIATNGATKTGYVIIASKINDTTLLINVSDTGSGIISPLTSGAYIIDLTSIAIQLELTP